MNDLRSAIESRLHELEGPNVQLQLDLNPEERSQWNTDLEALRGREDFRKLIAELAKTNPPKDEP